MQKMLASLHTSWHDTSFFSRILTSLPLAFLMSEQNKQSFFAVNVASILQILQAPGLHAAMSSNELLALLAQCAGVCSMISHDHPTSTHGRGSVAKRTGLGERAAQRALDNLVAAGHLRPAPAAPHGVLPGRVEATYLVDAAINGDVKLSSDLLQEPQGDAPLRETLTHLKENIAVADGIPARPALVDAICVFLALHQSQDFNECSGVDPYLVRGFCSPIKPEEDGPGTSAIRPLVGQSDWSLLTVRKEQLWTIDSAFVENTIPTIKVDDLTEDKTVRFRHALAQLRRSHLVHDVLVVWDGEPIPDTTRTAPTVWSTLYVGKRRDMEREFQLIDAVHNAAFATGTLDRDRYMSAHSDDQVEKTGRYRYVVPTHMATTARLVPQLRARRWGYTADTLKGLQGDAARVNQRRKDLEQVIASARHRAPEACD